MREHQPETITASEIADWVYCPEAWRLAKVGTPLTPAIRVARTEGTTQHVERAAVEAAAGRSIDTGRGLIFVGAAVLVILAMLWAVTR